jgi:sugar phosphate isomerase/epimerase
MEGLRITGRQSEIIELALSFGFRGMDLDMEEFAQQVELYGLPHARRLIDSARIQVGEARLPVEWIEWNEEETRFRQGLAALPRLAELAASVGCRRCVTEILPACDDRPYHENFEFHRRRLGQIADVLAPQGIRLGLQFLAPSHLRKGRAFQFIHSLDALLQLAKSVPAENVGVVYDVWNVYVSEGVLEDVSKLPVERIVSVYLSDAHPDMDRETMDEADRHLPGETGAIDCGPLLGELKEMGYDGPVSARAGRKSLEGKKRDEIVRAASERLQRFWPAAGVNPSGKVFAARGH